MGAAKDIQVAAALLLASVLAGGLNVKLRSDLPWIADAPSPEATACTAQELALPSEAMKRISTQELAQRLANPQAPVITLVDARSGQSYTQGHIPGADSFPAVTAPELLLVQSIAIRRDAPVVTYCDGGECELSESLAILLQQDVGCREVMVLEGGYAAWTQAGLPVVQGNEAGRWPLEPKEEAAP